MLIIYTRDIYQGTNNMGNLAQVFLATDKGEYPLTRYIDVMTAQALVSACMQAAPPGSAFPTCRALPPIVISQEEQCPKESN